MNEHLHILAMLTSEMGMVVSTGGDYSLMMLLRERKSRTGNSSALTVGTNAPNDNSRQASENFY